MNWQVRVMSIVACVGGLSVVSAAQTFRSVTELVNLNVTVVGPNASHVPGLTSEQFEVREDGIVQPLKFFAAGETPVDVMLLLDTSSSMTESMPFVRAAATRFVDAMRRGDRAGVMGIASGLRVLQPLTADPAALNEAIQATRALGRTPLYASLYSALNELEKIRRQEDGAVRRQAMVVLTDGNDTSSAFGFEELLPVVRRHAVPIYTIAPRQAPKIRLQRESIFGESTARQDFELRTLATDTGARAFFPVTLRDLSGIYDDIANELAHQYSLGYQSSNGSHDGAFRRIALRVIAPNVKWRTRTGYIAER
jgi:Ca-activated chloride channel homolog